MKKTGAPTPVILNHYPSPSAKQHKTFFKQKTAYEMESRDWSSDVCSSD
eukprot:COSAG03_NODE_18059_length_363_cov_0.515152_1_plen_48_part_10